MGQGIPAPDGVADFVCFFSVFTHLLHEDIYRYLRDAKRTLRPGGRIVFTFLDFAVGSHWPIFAQRVESHEASPVLNQFIGRDAIQAWADHLGLRIVAIHDGPEPWINLVEDFHYADGRHATTPAEMGQSLAVLTHLEGFR